MDNSRKNAIKLLIQGFKCNLNDSFDENSIEKVCSSCEEHIYKLCNNESQKKYRSDINNFVILLKNNNNYDIKIEYLKGSINEDEFIFKISNSKNNNIKKRQLSKDNRNKIYSPSALHIIKERRANSQSKDIDMEKKEEKEINEIDQIQNRNGKNNGIINENKSKEIINNPFQNIHKNKSNNINRKNSTDINENIGNKENKNKKIEKEKEKEKEHKEINKIEKEKEEINNIDKKTKNEYSSFEKLQKELNSLKPGNNKNIREKRNRSAFKEKNNINLIELEIENKKLNLENEKLKSQYNLIRKELLNEKEKNLKINISNEKLLLENKMLNEKISKLMKEIEKLKKLNEMYTNNYNQMKEKVDLKNQSIDFKLQKLTDNLNLMTANFFNSSISKLNIEHTKSKNDNIKKNSISKISAKEEKIEEQKKVAKNEEHKNKFMDKLKESKESKINNPFEDNNNNNIDNNNNNLNKINNSIFDASVSYRSFLDNLNV